MKTLPIYQVDAFAPSLFTGNPAAVIPLESWLPDETLQQIAGENNLSETAYFVQEASGLRIRWFTPTAEVDLCGHATLATAYILFNELNYPDSVISFESRSGKLTVTKDESGLLTLNFPIDTLERVETPQFIIDSIEITPIETFKGVTDYLSVIESEDDLEKLKPDFKILQQLQSRGLIVTAKSSRVDFVSRCFYPNVGIDEDPATGSAHTTLTTYWSQHINKEHLTAVQLSKRKGFFICSMKGDRVEISGQAKLYMAGKIFVDSII